MTKRIFQVLDEMNLEDVETNSRLVGVCTEIIEMKKVSGGAIATIAIPEEMMIDIMTGERIAFLVILNKEEYIKRKV